MLSYNDMLAKIEELNEVEELDKVDDLIFEISDDAMNMSEFLDVLQMCLDTQAYDNKEEGFKLILDFEGDGYNFKLQ